MQAAAWAFLPPSLPVLRTFAGSRVGCRRHLKNGSSAQGQRESQQPSGGQGCSLPIMPCRLQKQGTEHGRRGLRCEEDTCQRNVPVAGVQDFEDHFDSLLFRSAFVLLVVYQGARVDVGSGASAQVIALRGQAEVRRPGWGRQTYFQGGAEARAAVAPRAWVLPPRDTVHMPLGSISPPTTSSSLWLTIST